VDVVSGVRAVAGIVAGMTIADAGEQFDRSRDLLSGDTEDPLGGIANQVRPSTMIARRAE
jgi:hypothetical protein